MLQRIRNSFYTKVVAVYMAFSLVGDIIYPVMTYGLTSGPIDINQASFEPASTSEMVNLANGDFTYNIPLMDVDGYPINIAYHGGISMEQEASMVGLGWTLNVGAMNRIKKGLPDDFNGDEIKTTMNLRPRTSTKASIGIGAEIVGGEVDPNQFNIFDILTPTLGLEAGVTFNNYYGFGLDLGANSGVLIGNSNTNYNLGLGLGVNSSSQNGLSISPYANLSVGVFKGDNAAIQGKIGIGFTINSLQGLQTISTTTGIGIKPGEYGGVSEGVKTTGNIPVSTISYTPSISFETNSNSINFDFDFGYELPTWTTVHGKGTFSRSSTCLQQNVSTAKGYGYLYEHHKNENYNYLMDFNRDGRVIPNEHIAYLPITNHTFDVFNATAQGVGFSSRAFRSDVLAVSDPKKYDVIGGFGASGEVSVGTVFQAGLNLNFVNGYIQTGKWLENNPAADEFVKNSNPNQLYEHAYFKKFGNRSTANSNFYSTLFYDLPLKQSIDGTSGQSGLAQFETEFGSTFDFSSMNHYKTERDLRNTSMEYFTTNEAESFGLEDNINSYSIDETNGYNYGVNGYSSTIVNRNGLNIEDLKEHHIGEMSVLKGDGSRYVYGIPVVNTRTYEVMFNVSDHSSMASDLALTKDCKTGLVSYNPNVDNSMDNRRGDNNLFIKKEIPASANSFLLSAYLSSNYIDRTQNGPTPDDLGNYTKFNYAKMSQNTKWRFPYEENTAMYNPGLQSDEYDDMGSYLYGEREQWYLHSIESKNFVAEFHYSDRVDGRGVIDENGGVDNSTGAAAKKLDYIALYTIEGKKNGEAPIKTVHFEYNYELCPNVPNSINTTSGDNGKLTLQAIYFTYGNSQKGKLHKYTFDYSNYNPSYSLGETDRWGGYSPANANASCGETGGLNQFEYPYANQNKTEADLNASAWMLNTIHLPSGSQINIDVEADDYSYLQDKLPSKMFKVVGLTDDGTLASIEQEQNVIYQTIGGPNNFIHIKLDQEIIGNYSDAKNEFIHNYLRDIKKLYFKFLVSITRRGVQGSSNEKFEYVSGYADINENNVSLLDSDNDVNNNDYDMAVLELKGVKVGDGYGEGNTNQISKAAWQMIRKYLPRVLNSTVGNIYTNNDSRPYGYNCDVDENLPVDPDNTDHSPSTNTNNEGTALMDLYNIGVSQLQTLMSFGGINNMFKAQGYASKFVPEKSWVRLYQGSSHKKIGGGHRVKEISVNDNWNDVKNIEQSSQYGTVYNYETTSDGGEYASETIISSGVASYEPISAGADENTFRSPEEYTINVLFRVNDEEFQEKPIGESIFASPNVVYSKVTVKNINYSGIEQDATGHTEYEFYTAKDFPTASKAKSTGKANVGKLEDNNSIIEALLGINYNYLTMSQGYSINVNDMHGKFKSKTVKSSGISPVEIYYLGHKYYQNGNELNNFMTVVNEDGVISNRNMGKDIDMVLDLTYSNSYSESITGQFGIDVGSFPVPIPSFWTSTSSQNSTFQSSVTTKVVYSNGILEEVELRDKGRTKKTKNVLFDAKTGVPVVSEIITESEPTPANPNLPEPIKIYQYDYPAYWAYNGMGLASENWGATFDGTNFYNGSTGIVNTQNTPFLNPGDEIGVLNSTNQSQVNKYWVVEDESNPGSYYLQDKLGNVIASGFNTSDYVFKVVKSGNKNLLGSTFMSITSLDNNINTTTTNNVVTAYSSPYDGSISHSRILNASAVEYTEKASAYASNDCGDLFQGVIVGDKVNPYIHGMLGNWNLLASYVLDVERDQTINNIREDGTLSNYVAYWVNNSNSKWVKNVDPTVAEKWITAAIATLFDGEGYNLESKDALGIYSSILLGYNNTLKIAEAVNARYYEVGFDGFEDRDYDMVTCPQSEKHFRVDGTIANEGHTGRHSLVIYNKGISIEIPLTNTIDETITTHGIPFTVSGSDVIDPFTFIISDTETKKYVFTAWVKGDQKNEAGVSYELNFIVNGPNVSLVKERKSNIIDGWQRVEYIFEYSAQTIAANVSSFIHLSDNLGGQLLIDDIRIQPYNSEMVSYVIDPISLRLWATLDSRNFATFYQYDEEGSLVRIIQETEKGKVTVQENRAGIRIH